MELRLDAWLQQCLQCSYKAEWGFQLEHHIRQAHRNVRQADARFVTNSASCKSYEQYTQAHLLINSKNYCKCDFKTEDLICKNCGKFETCSSLHLVKHRKSCMSRFACDQCSYVSKRKYNLYRHKLKHNLYKCTQCSFVARSKGFLNKYVVLMHGPEGEHIKWYKCSECSYQTKFNSTFKRHVLGHVQQQDVIQYKCSQCSFQTKQKWYLATHVQRVHGSEDGGFKCEQCEYKAKYRTNLLTHVFVTHRADTKAELQYQHCENEGCSFETVGKTALQRHVIDKHASPAEIKRFHAPAKAIERFKCANCSYESKYKTCVTKHMTMHCKKL